jgi:hypothetical protein
LNNKIFEEICDKVTSLFKDEFKYINYNLYEDTFANINPIFETTNPHEDIYNLLLSNSPKIHEKYSRPISSNFVPYILLQDTILEQINPYIKSKTVDLKFVQFISILIRMLAYDQLAKYNNLHYIPATSRMDNELLDIPINEYDILRIKDGFNKKDVRPDALNGINDIVDALIICSNGEPLKIINHAFILRNKMETFRKIFSEKNTSDALLLEKFDIIKEYQFQLNMLLSSETNNSTGLLIKQNTAIIGFPQKIIKSNLKKRWFNYKKANDNIKHLASMFLYADERRRKITYLRLLKKSLLPDIFNDIIYSTNIQNDIDVNKWGKNMGTNSGNIGIQIIGNNNKIGKIDDVEISSNVYVNSETITSDIDTLVNELKKLDPRYNKEIVALSKAKKNLEKNNIESAKTILKKVGAEVWSIAKQVGIPFLIDFAKRNV